MIELAQSEVTWKDKHWFPSVNRIKLCVSLRQAGLRQRWWTVAWRSGGHAVLFPSLKILDVSEQLLKLEL